MEILLRDNVERLGLRGEIVTVKDGYARNYLLPQGLAYPATSGYGKRLAQEKRRLIQQEAKRRQQLQEIANKINDSSVTIEMQATAEGQLYGSVTPHILQLAFQQENIVLTEESIKIEQGRIKDIGVYSVEVVLAPDIRATCKVWIVAEGA